jgi:cation transport ATPase
LYVAIDGAPAEVVLLDDRVREDAATLVPSLHAAGIRHTALVTGDKAAIAERVAGELGIERVYAEQTPEENLEIVRALQAEPGLRNVVMVGDGINDAPALALADVGIATGRIGATVPRRPPTPSSSSTAWPTPSGSGDERSRLPARASSSGSAPPLWRWLSPPSVTSRS